MLLISCALYAYRAAYVSKHNSLLARVTYLRYNIEQTLGLRQYMYWYWLSEDIVRKMQRVVTYMINKRLV